MVDKSCQLGMDVVGLVLHFIKYILSRPQAVDNPDNADPTTGKNPE